MNAQQRLLNDMIALFAEGNNSKAKDVFHNYAQLKMKQVMEAMTGKNSNFTDADHKKLAAVSNIEDAKEVVGSMIDKCKSSKSKKEHFRRELNKCSTVTKCQQLGYNVLMAGEGLGTIKEGADCTCIQEIEQIDPSQSPDAIIKRIVDITSEVPEVTVAHINDLMTQAETLAGQELIDAAKDIVQQATGKGEYQDEQMHEDDDLDDIDGGRQDFLTGDELEDEEFEELDLPEAVQDALDGIENEQARQMVEDAIIEFMESGMDEGGLEDQIEDFDHLVTGVMTRCQEECEENVTEQVTTGLEHVKQALFGEQSEDDNLDMGDEEHCDTCAQKDAEQDAEFEDELEHPKDRKFGDLVSAKRIGVGSM